MLSAERQDSTIKICETRQGLAVDTVFKLNPLRSIRDIFCTITRGWQAHSPKSQDRYVFHRQTPAGVSGKNERESLETGETASKGFMTFWNCVAVFKHKPKRASS
jgi:hypothetical protein